MDDPTQPVGWFELPVIESDTHARAPTVALGSDTHERRPPARADEVRVDVGTRVGRYLVLEHIGRGGMGVVVRAYDPKLRRELALKLVHSRGGSQGGKVQARLLREAQSLAKLSDPHVVAVYDAELTEQGVYIAMEYVEGRNLRAWLGQAPRVWTEVLPVLTAVARGLVAAHAEGIVHRDIKPDNVLVSDSGRVRLTDFGLARERQDASDTGSGRAGAVEHDEDEVLTEAGTVMGTPAYMAPEQHTGQTADDRCDQYALCVMCWEALHGERPFRDKTVATLHEAKRRGPPERPAGRVPEWLHAIVARGLAVDPSARWPSVHAMLEALERGQARARRRRAVFGLGVVACVGVAGLAWQRVQQAAAVAACEREGERIAEVWNDQAREELRAAFVATNVAYAGETVDKVMPWIDERARAWQAAQTEACLDTHVHGTWSADVHARATWCLDERKMDLEALVTEFGRVEPRGVAKAVQAAAGLSAVEPCLDAQVLARRPTPPAGREDEVRDVRGGIAASAAALHTGNHREALKAADLALASAQTLAWPPLVAQARIARAGVLGRAGDHAGAEAELEAAFFGALQAGEAALAATAAEELVFVVGYQRARHEDGLRWSRHAEALSAGQPDPGELRLAAHLDHRAGIAWARGEYDDALAFNLRALELREAALGEEHPGIATSLVNLANARAAAGALDEAKALLERALPIWERSVGSRHPLVATTMSNLGGVEQQRGAYEAAEELARRALAIREALFGPVHPDVADSLNNLAGIALARGDTKAAEDLFRQSLDVSERALGREHPDVARGLYNLATVLTERDAHEEAKALAERALAIRQAQLGPDHADVAQSLNGLANVCAELGEYDEAHAYFERALAVYEKALGPDHPHLAYALGSMAELALVRDEPSAALPLAERAVTLREAANVPPQELARARFLLARALWDAKADRTRARTLAEQARDGYRKAGPGGERPLKDVSTWLTDHPAG